MDCIVETWAVFLCEQGQNTLFVWVSKAELPFDDPWSVLD